MITFLNTSANNPKLANPKRSGEFFFNVSKVEEKEQVFRLYKSGKRTSKSMNMSRNLFELIKFHQKIDKHLLKSTRIATNNPKLAKF